MPDVRPTQQPFTSGAKGPDIDYRCGQSYWHNRTTHSRTNRCARDTAILAIVSTMLETTQAGMPERPKGADCKSAGNAFGGSNPSPGTKRGRAALHASLAQW
jgi:hypothetical protein